MTIIVTEKDKLDYAVRMREQCRVAYPKALREGRISAGREALLLAIVDAIVDDYVRSSGLRAVVESPMPGADRGDFF